MVSLVITAMKNEGPYVLEWFAHYRALGFERFVVQWNDCDDTTVGILERLAHLTGRVDLRRTLVRKGGIHQSAMRQARRHPWVAEADWVFVCDADELLNIHVGDGSLQALIAASGPDTDVIRVPWRIFGSGGIRRIKDRPMADQFTRAETIGPTSGRFEKSLFRRPGIYQRFGLHRPVPAPAGPAPVMRWAGGFVGAEGGAPPRAVFSIAQVNHYAVRSRDAYLVKRDRGRANHMNHVLGLDYWRKFDRNEVEDQSIARYREIRAAIEEPLRTDARLVRLHRQALAWHQAKAEAMRGDPALVSLVEAMMQPAASGPAAPAPLALRPAR